MGKLTYISYKDEKILKVSMFSISFLTSKRTKTGCSLGKISPERVSVRFPDQVGKKKWEERKGTGGAEFWKLHSGSGDENGRAR